MPTSEHLVVGTSDGVVVLELDGGATHALGRFLPGEPIVHVAVPRHGKGTTFYAAARKSGLHEIDLVSGTSRALGGDVITGSVRALAVNMWREGDIWVGTAPVALYRSTDGGETWHELPAMRELAAERKWEYPAAAGSPPHLRWLQVTTERVWAAAQIGGVVRSDDEGSSWTDFVDGLDPDVHMVVAHDRYPEVLLAATGGGGWPWGAYPPDPPLGYPLYRSDDLGATWRSIAPDAAQRYSTSVWVSPADPQRIVLGTADGVPAPGVWSRPQGADGLVMQTDDGGTSWSVSEGIPRPLTYMPEVLAGNPYRMNVVYLGTGGEGARFVPTGPKGQLFRSEDEGRSWEQVSFDLAPVTSLAPLAAR